MRLEHLNEDWIFFRTTMKVYKKQKDRLKNLSFPLKSAFVNQIQIYEKKSITNIVYNSVKVSKIKLIDVKLYSWFLKLN